MGIKGACRFIFHRLFEAFVVILLIVFLPHLPPYSNFSESFRLASFKPFEGKLALNERLGDVEKWHKGEVAGPEAFADYNGELYASLYGGDIVKLTGDHITPVTKTGKPCKGNYEERICGRPLGMEFDKDGALFVADAYYGIFKVDVKTGERVAIVPSDLEIDGKKPKIFNSIALASNGDIYWSDSSTQFHLEDGMFDMLADPSGRLIRYDARTKQNEVIIDKLHFANGVALSAGEDFVVVAESARNRIHRYYLKGPKKGTRDIFIDGLPGLPDNLKADGRGGFLVPLIIAADDEHPMATQVVAPFPLLRRLIARVFGLTQLGFETVNKVYPCEFAQRAVHFIGHFSSFIGVFSPARVTIIHLSSTGEILDSLHTQNKKITFISEAHPFKDSLYLGSPFNDFIGRIPLAKVNWQQLAPERKKREVPSEQTTRAPTTTTTTTTTQRPTTAQTTTTQRPTTAQTTTTQRPTTTTQATTTTTQRPTTTQATTTPRPTATPTTIPSPTPKATAAPTRQPPPAPKQQSPPPPPPPPKQSSSPPPPKQPSSPPPPPKQQPPPPPAKQSSPPPPPKQQAPPPPTPQSKQQSPPPPSPKPQAPSPAKQPATPPPPPKPSSAPPSTKQQPPPTAQPVKDQPKPVPVKEPAKN